MYSRVRWTSLAARAEVSHGTMAAATSHRARERSSNLRPPVRSLIETHDNALRKRTLCAVTVQCGCEANEHVPFYDAGRRPPAL